jgi:hypothetical protein
VTPARRLAGREVRTLEGLPEVVRNQWATALVATGGSQCGFCTPGIVMRLAGRDPAGLSGWHQAASGQAVEEVPAALVGHLCRCTGWQTIQDAARLVYSGHLDSAGSAEAGDTRSTARAAARAAIEGGVPQRVGPEVALGQGGFSDDTAPSGAWVAVPDGNGDYVVADTVAGARALAGKVQGRRTTVPLVHPVGLPVGEWALSLQTTWVEPAYVEPDASWCVPGGVPAVPFANGGAFGGKHRSPVPEVARALADRHGRPVRVLWSREDVVRWGPKRPPVAIGMDPDGVGVLRVGVTRAAWSEAEWASVEGLVATVAPGLVVETVPIAGPPVSLDLRAAVWAEAAVLAACARAYRSADGTGGVGSRSMRDVPVTVVSPSGGEAVVRCLPDDSLVIDVDAGEVLDEVVLASYCIGAAHQALGWVRSEGIAVDAGTVHDLTVRSFGILPARATPRITVEVRPGTGDAVNGSDAVFVAVAAAVWLADGLVPAWPTSRRGHLRTSTGAT